MTRGDFFERYGTSFAVLAVLVLALVLLPGNRDGSSSLDTGFSSGFDAAGGEPFVASAPSTSNTTATSTTAATSSTVAAAAGAGAPTDEPVAAPGKNGPVAASTTLATSPAASSPADADGDATAGPPAVDEGGNCRAADGRQAGIAFHMPPCARHAGADNGGSTFRGVSEDEILVVLYRSQVDPGTQAALESASAADSPAVSLRAFETLARYWNLHAETYGREVVVQRVDASGPPTSEEAARADALRIAQDIRPFAVVDENPTAPMPTVLAQELGQRGVLCMCTGGTEGPLSSNFYASLPPAIVPESATMDEFAAHLAEYIAKKLEGRPAEYAGDDQTIGQNFTTSTRKYGLLYRNGRAGVVDPELERLPGIVKRELAEHGVGGDRIVEIGYNFEPGRNQADMTNIIARFKSEGVTTVVPYWDAITPIIITSEATRQQYFPEWLHTGAGFTDISAGGRLYDQTQWQNSFGISALAVPWATVSDSPGYREYHHACIEGCEPGDEGVQINLYRPRVETLFIGIHMAGPNLTNESFIRGLYDYPPTGGLPAAPLVFFTRQFPGKVKDFTEIWYDPDRSGEDERGQEGVGMIVKVDGGRRYRLGEWTAEQKMFVEDGAVAAASDAPGSPPDHEQDGHRHPEDRRCLSCG